MGFITTFTGDITITSVILTIYTLINLPRLIHIIRRIFYSHSIISNKNRLSCNWYDLGFIVSGISFILTSLLLNIFSHSTSTASCISLIFINIAIYQCGGTMILHFLYNRVLLFVSSAGNWIKLHKLFAYYPYSMSLSIITHFVTLLIFAITFKSENPSIPENKECDYSTTNGYSSCYHQL